VVTDVAGIAEIWLLDEGKGAAVMVGIRWFLASSSPVNPSSPEPEIYWSGGGIHGGMYFLRPLRVIWALLGPANQAKTVNPSEF
jgi:hypothetical protein